MFPHFDLLSPVQVQVLDLLAAGHTVAAAAAEAGVHRNTVANWRRSSPAFRDCELHTRREQAAHWRDEIQALAPAALETLRLTMTDEQASASTRLRAALAILDKAAVPLPPPIVQSPKIEKTAQVCTTAPLLDSFEAVVAEVKRSAAAEDVEIPDTPYQEMLRQANLLTAERMRSGFAFAGDVGPKPST